MKATTTIKLAIIIIIATAISITLASQQQVNAADNSSVTNCMDITSSGTYTMSANISNSAETICFNISIDDVIFDCANYIVDGADTPSSEGIYSIGYSNITIKNCNVSDWKYNLYFENCTDVNITSNNLTSATYDEVFFKNVSDSSIMYNDFMYGEYDPTLIWNSDNITLSGNTITGYGSNINGLYFYNTNNSVINSNTITSFGSGAGISLKSTSTNNTISDNTLTTITARALYILQNSSYNTITNNTFTATVNTGIEIDDSVGNNIYNNKINASTLITLSAPVYANYWNTTEQTGTRVYSSGTKIGGNYYANSTSTAYSDSCTDSDTDGFCDSCYNISSNSAAGSCSGDNIDSLPLSDEYVGPESNIDNCTELNAVNHIYTLNASASNATTCMLITAENITLDCLGNSIDYSTNGVAAIAYGVYSTQNKTTIKNCVITQSQVGGSAKNAIYFLNVHNSLILNNTITTIELDCYGIMLKTSNNNNVSYNDITLKGIGSRNTGIMFWTSSHNELLENTITTTRASHYGIQFYDDSENNSIDTTDIYTNSSLAYAILLNDGNQNFTITDSLINASFANTAEIYFDDDATGGIINLINVTRTDGNDLNASWKSSGNGTVYVKWHFDVNITNASSNPIVSATVNSWNKDGTLQFTKTTDATGFITTQALTEYTKNRTTITYLSNYTINASKTGYDTNSALVNITTNSQKDISLNIDTIPPTMTLQSPTNTTYATLPIDINVTVNEAANWCAYNLNDGTNTTLSNSTTTNWYSQTNSSLVDGELYNIIIYCNDTTGNMGINNTIWFTYNATDTTPPTITIVSPTNITYSASIDINVTVNEAASNCLYNIGGSNTTLSNSSTTNWFTILTTSTDNTYQFSVYCNDTSGNLALNSSIWFTFTTVSSSGGGGGGSIVETTSCGNGICDNNETFNDCPEDCASAPWPDYELAFADQLFTPIFGINPITGQSPAWSPAHIILALTLFMITIITIKAKRK